MYGSEVTWRGQEFFRDEVQRSTNRMSRSSLGVFKSTPVSFLQSFGGSTPAEPRLNQRQAAFAVRAICSTHPSTRQIASGSTALARKLKVAVAMEDLDVKEARQEGSPFQASWRVERPTLSQKSRSPSDVLRRGGEEDQE